MELTNTQRATLEWIEGFIGEHGMPPTVREIGKAFGIKSSSVFQRLKTLERKGFLKRGNLGARSLEMTNPAGPLFCTCSSVPLLGRIAAGQPILAVENIEGRVAVDPRLVKGETFALTVQGDSMIEDGILDGDCVIVRHQSTAREGDIVVALVEDDATVKRFYREKKGWIRLQPANAAMEPILVKEEEVQVQGKVIAVERILR